MNGTVFVQKCALVQSLVYDIHACILFLLLEHTCCGLARTEQLHSDNPGLLGFSRELQPFAPPCGQMLYLWNHSRAILKAIKSVLGECTLLHHESVIKKSLHL